MLYDRNQIAFQKSDDEGAGGENNKEGGGGGEEGKNEQNWWYIEIRLRLGEREKNEKLNPIFSNIIYLWEF